MIDLTKIESDILAALNSVFDRFQSDYGEALPVATWHVRLEMDNKFTSPQIRKTLKLLDDFGLVSGKKDGNNIVWTPIKEQSK